MYQGNSYAKYGQQARIHNDNLTHMFIFLFFSCKHCTHMKASHYPRELGLILGPSGVLPQLTIFGYWQFVAHPLNVVKFENEVALIMLNVLGLSLKCKSSHQRLMNGYEILTNESKKSSILSPRFSKAQFDMSHLEGNWNVT